MRIGYIITRSDWGGAQAHLYDLIRYACEHTLYQCYLIVGEEGRLSEQVRALGIPVFVVPTLVQPIHPLKDILAIRSIIRLLKETKPHILHLHSTKAGMIGRIAARLTRTPSIFTAHGWAFTEGVSSIRRRISLPLERMVAPLCQSIICVSEYDRQLALRSRVGTPEQLITIHNGIPVLDSRYDVYEDGVENKEIVSCMMVARFSEQKDYATLLYAAAGTEVPLQLNLVGQGELTASMRELVEKLGVADRVNFMGPRSDVPDLLADNDIFVLTTNYEGFPISILEAMRAGLPVIATDVGGVREAVMDGETGFLVPRGDVEAVRNRLEILASDADLRKRMGQAGRERFLCHFTARHMLEETFSLYSRILSKKGSVKSPC